MRAKKAHVEGEDTERKITQEEAIDIAKLLRVDQGRALLLDFLGEPEDERHSMENLSDGRENRPEHALKAADNRPPNDPDDPKNYGKRLNPNYRDEVEEARAEEDAKRAENNAKSDKDEEARKARDKA